MSAPKSETDIRRRMEMIYRRRIIEFESRIAFLEREKEGIVDENLRLLVHIDDLEVALAEAVQANREICHINEPLRA